MRRSVMSLIRSVRSVWLIVFVVACFASLVQALPYLPAIPNGDISIRLTPVATGMAAPDYGISPPGDTSRLFVVERSEEHTSELQSHSDLVCRLLLEKKKKKKYTKH